MLVLSARESVSENVSAIEIENVLVVEALE